MIHGASGNDILRDYPCSYTGQMYFACDTSNPTTSPTSNPTTLPTPSPSRDPTAGPTRYPTALIDGYVLSPADYDNVDGVSVQFGAQCQVYLSLVVIESFSITLSTSINI